MHSQHPAAAFPQLSSDVLIGPAERRKGKVFFYVKQRLSGRVFRVGAREGFVLSQCTGKNHFDAIRAAYNREFVTPLSAVAWEHLLGLLQKRQLLAHSEGDAVLAAGALSERPALEPFGVFGFRMRLVNPSRWLDWLSARTGLLFKRVVVGPMLVSVICVEFFVLFHLKQMYSELVAVSANHQQWASVAVMVVLVVGLITCIHELSHAVTCRHFGGEIRDMGVTFRYLTFVPYTSAADVMLFHNRVERLWVFLAGTISSLFLGIPFVALWWFLPGHSAVRTASCLIVLILNVLTLTNFIPFLQFDGYFMLSTILRMPDLRVESYDFLLSLARRAVGLKIEAFDYTRRELITLVVYGSLSCVVSAAFLLMALQYWQSLIERSQHPAAAWILFIAGLAGILAWRRYQIASKEPAKIHERISN